MLVLAVLGANVDRRFGHVVDDHLMCLVDEDAQFDERDLACVLSRNPAEGFNYLGELADAREGAACFDSGFVAAIKWRLVGDTAARCAFRPRSAGLGKQVRAAYRGRMTGVTWGTLA